MHWFISHLGNSRLQRVVIDGKSSDWLPVTSGVPQGSLLGPALFVLFINDMPSALSHSSALASALFADDAECFRAIGSYTDCALLQDDIDKLVDWSNNWKLAFSVDKCSLCTVTRKRNPIICNYKMGAEDLSRVKAQRDLGVLCQIIPGAILMYSQTEHAYDCNLKPLIRKLYAYECRATGLLLYLVGFSNFQLSHLSCLIHRALTVRERLGTKECQRNGWLISV